MGNTTNTSMEVMRGNKRWWTWRKALLAIGVLTGLIAAWAVLIEPGWWRVDRTTVALDRLDPRVDGLTIDLLTLQAGSG